MTCTSDEHAKSLKNLSDAINCNHRFPQNVFVGQWDHFFFFDSDWMFDVEFLDRVKALLEIEKGMCACLANIDEISDHGRSDRSLFIDQRTTPDAYQSRLRGSPEGGWINDMGRFGCASEVGQWCVYCERNNEIAVIAFRRGSFMERYRAPLAKVKAESIEKAIEQPLSYGFSAQALSPQWRSEFRRHYA